MKGMLLFFIFSSSLSANSLQQMDQRLKIYEDSVVKDCSEGNLRESDDGLFVDVSCSFKCTGKGPKVEHVRDTFIPRDHGLFPGNGSNGENTIWSSVGITLKTWSHQICLQKAATGCQEISKVEEVKVNHLESGKWRLDRFPACKEKSIVLSPFDDTSGSKRIISDAGALLEKMTRPAQDEFEVQYPGMNFKVAFVSSSSNCVHKIKGNLCFGDCIDLSVKELKETLGTKDPLGFQTYEVCGDVLMQKLKEAQVGPSVKKVICEEYFWKTLMHEKITPQSCAALRGEVDCSL